MQKTDDAGRTAPLVLELASGTARLHGEELELPLREFRLLAALAARVGEPVASDLLIKAVWPDAPWTSNNDLYVLVSKLRRLIDGPDKYGNNIRNRRGFGYLLDIERDQLVVIDPQPVEPIPLTIDLTGRPPQDPVPQSSVAEPPASDEELRPSAALVRRGRRWPFAASLAIALIAASWGAGYVLSKRNSDQHEVTRGGSPEIQPPSSASENKGSSVREDGRRRPRKDEKERRPRKSHTARPGSAVVIADPGTTDATTEPVPATSRPRQGSPNGEKEKEPVPPALPPAPTRYLYHLVNQSTGDHFVTTDGNTASEYEAMGYEGGPIARVYTYNEEGTKAISTNHGPAYIFISSSPKTEPSSRAVALWYSTNHAGDFFYATSEAEAKQSGWQATVIGYARSL